MIMLTAAVGGGTAASREAAAEWTLQISDEKLRREAVETVTGVWGVVDQQAAEAWIKAKGQP